MSAIPFTDPHCYERHECARELDLKRERVGPMMYHVESEQRTHFYTVLLTEDGYQCNCWAKAQ